MTGNSNEEQKLGCDYDVGKAQESFAIAAEPLMKFLAENYNPHAVVIVNASGAELLTGELTHNTEKFLVD